MSTTPKEIEGVLPFEAVSPIRSDYLSQAEVIARTGMNRAIDALADEKRERVSEACCSIGLSEEATKHVLATTCDLICFEQFGRNSILTTAQRFDALAEVRDLADALANALETLPTEERVALYTAFINVRKELGGTERLEFEHAHLPDGRAIEVLSLSAHVVLEARPADEGKGGRPRMLDAYTRYVAGLASTFEAEGMAVGRGGAFERLCAVVFEVAGVRAEPEGAIRNLSKWRKR